MKSLVVRFSLKVLEQHIMKLRLFACLLGFALLLGCGGSGAGTSTNGKVAPPPPPPPTSTAVLVNIGDFGVDQIVSFELTIDSVALHSSSGDVSLLSTPRRFEFSRLPLKLEPLLLDNVAQGNYSAVAIGVSNPRVSFIDSSGLLHQDVAPSLTSSTYTIDVPFSIGSTPVLFNLTPLANSVSIGDDNVVTVTARFGASGPFEVQNGVGAIQDLVGRVTTVSSSSFTIDVGNGAFTFATDSNTKLQGITALSGLTAGMTVEVDAVFYSDGTLRANNVEVESDLASAVLLEGVTLSLSLAQLQMLVREVHGSGDISVPIVGKAVTVDASASTQFRIESEHVDLNNLDFTPTFDALTMASGQNVRAVASSGNATAITADQLKLEEQSLDGIAGALTAGSTSGQFSFPLNLSADSAFARLTGHTTALVTVQPSTWLDTGDWFAPCITCVPGKPVRVRGLLFFSVGQYHLVAEGLALI